MISFIMLLVMLTLMFKGSLFIIGFFGRMIGSLIGCIFYIVIGIIGLTLFGLGLFVIPIVIVAGIAGILYAITKTV